MDGEGMHMALYQSELQWMLDSMDLNCVDSVTCIFFNKYSTCIFILLVFEFAKYEENFVFI